MRVAVRVCGGDEGRVGREKKGRVDGAVAVRCCTRREEEGGDARGRERGVRRRRAERDMVCRGW